MRAAKIYKDFHGRGRPRPVLPVWANVLAMHGYGGHRDGHLLGGPDTGASNGPDCVGRLATCLGQEQGTLVWLRCLKCKMGRKGPSDRWPSDGSASKGFFSASGFPESRQSHYSEHRHADHDGLNPDYAYAWTEFTDPDDRVQTFLTGYEDETSIPIITVDTAGEFLTPHLRRPLTS
jgi:hypothetical protein